MYKAPTIWYNNRLEILALQQKRERERIKLRYKKIRLQKKKK